MADTRILTDAVPFHIGSPVNMQQLRGKINER